MMRGKSIQLLVLAAFALIVQVAFVFETNRAVVFRIPTSDSASYHNQAVRIARGVKEPGQAPFWQPPLYTQFLGLVYRRVSSDVATVRYVHGWLGVLIALLTYGVARRFMSAPAAFACGLSTSFYGPLLFFASQLLPAALAAVLDAAFLLAFLGVMRRPTGRRALGVGVLLGVAALAVPVVLVMLVLVGAWLIVQARQTGEVRAMVRIGLVLLAGLVLAIAPVTLRNAIRSGQLVPISTNGGVNLYIGNNPDAARTVRIRPGTHAWDTLVALPYTEGGVSSPAQAQSFFLRRVGAYIGREPARFLGGLGAKVRQLVNGREIPRNVDIYVFRDHSRILGLLVWQWGWFAFPFGLVGPLAFVGMVVAWRRGGEGRTLVGFVVLYAAGLVLFFPSARYTVPMLPGLLVLAFLGAGGLRELVKGAAGCRVLYPVALLLGILAVNIPVAFPMDAVNWEAELHRHVAIGLQKRGLPDDALAQYDLALQADPAAAATHYYRGTAGLAAGRLRAAEADFRAALARRPDHPEAMHDLAVVLYRQQRADEAIAWLEQAIRLRPGYRSAMRNLAVALRASGRNEEAARWMQAAGE